jgi:predicted nucleic acid-binding Zn ribbon protein
MKKCPYCGAQMNDDSLFCTECGKQIPQGVVCPHCGASLNEGDVFCQSCGKRIDEIPSIEMPNTIQKKCPFCGVLINDGDVFCENCGRNISDGSYADTNITGEEIAENSVNPIKKFIPYLIGAIAIIAIGVGGWWYFNSSKSSQTVNDGSTVAVDSIAAAAEEAAIADDVDETNGVEMPDIHKIGSLFSEMESGKLTALKDYGFTLDDRQSKMIMSDYAEEGDEADIKLTKETYSLKYKIGNPSDMSEGRMKIRYVYAKDYGEPYMTIECDSKTWNSLKFEAESSLKKLEGNSYFLDMSSFINFDYEGAITVSTDNSVTWE